MKLNFDVKMHEKYTILRGNFSKFFDSRRISVNAHSWYVIKPWIRELDLKLFSNDLLESA